MRGLTPFVLGSFSGAAAGVFQHEYERSLSPFPLYNIFEERSFVGDPQANRDLVQELVVFLLLIPLVVGVVAVLLAKLKHLDPAPKDEAQELNVERLAGALLVGALAAFPVGKLAQALGSSFVGLDASPVLLLPLPIAAALTGGFVTVLLLLWQPRDLRDRLGGWVGVVPLVAALGSYAALVLAHGDHFGPIHAR